jgi:hypothetical protein
VTLVKSPYFHRPDPTDESYRNRPTKIAYLLSVFSEADKRYEANGRSQVYCSVLGHHSNDETAATNRLPITIEDYASPVERPIIVVVVVENWVSLTSS